MGLFDLFRTKPAAAVAPPRSVPRFPVDRARMFDLAQTARLEALFRTPQDQRDDLWQGAFYDAAWNASLVVAPAHFSGPEGRPYFRLDIPYPKASFESQPLGNLARSFVERGAGVAIFSSPEDAEDEAQFVLPMGLLDSLLRFDSPGGDPIDREESGASDDSSKFSQDVVGKRPEALIVTVEHEVVIGTPSPDFLPPYTARAVDRY